MYVVGREIRLDLAVHVHFCHSKWCEGEIEEYRVFSLIKYPVMTINSKPKNAISMKHILIK